MRQAELLRSHTVETAAQEVAHSAALRAPAALVIAHAMLAEQRLSAARFVEGDVLRISFGKTLAHKGVQSSTYKAA